MTFCSLYISETPRAGHAGCNALNCHVNHCRQMAAEMDCNSDTAQAACEAFQQRRQAAAENLGGTLREFLVPEPTPGHSTTSHNENAAEHLHIAGVLLQSHCDN